MYSANAAGQLLVGDVSRAVSSISWTHLSFCGCVSRTPRCFSRMVRWPPCSSEHCFGLPNTSASQIATFLACSFVKEANTSASAGSAPPSGQVALIRGILTAVSQDVHQLAEWIAHKESTNPPGLVSRSILDRDLCVLHSRKGLFEIVDLDR